MDAGTRPLRLLRVALAVCLLATFLLSRALWMSGRDYPLVPLIPGLPRLPDVLDWALFALMIGALAGIAVAPRPRPFLWTAVAVGGLWAVMDQTRWQPYMLTYTVALGTLLVHEAPSMRRARLPAGAWAAAPLQLAICATYVYSGLHKLNHHYLTIDIYWLVGPVGKRLAEAGPAVGAALGLATAALEAGMGAGLLFPRTRRAAVAGLTAMHAFILLALGPLGYATNSVVWPWNAFMIAAIWLLFWPREPAERFDVFRRDWLRRLRGSGDARIRPPTVLSTAWNVVLVVICILPLLSFVGKWDASLSFQLYAGKQPLVWVYFAPEREGEMPAGARVRQEVPGQVLLARWAMEEMNVAPVTSPRVVQGIGRALARRAPSADVKVVVAGPPAARSGAREFLFYTWPPPRFEPVVTPVATPAGWVEPSY